MIQMLKNKVLVAENKSEKVTDSGIVIANGAAATSDTKTGTVLSVGPDVKDVSVLDTVYVNWDKGTVVKIGDAYRLVISEEEIVAVLEK